MIYRAKMMLVLCLFLTGCVEYGQQPLEWVQTWGGTEKDTAVTVVADSLGHVYVMGEYGVAVESDSEQPANEHASEGYGVYLASFDSAGRVIWDLMWAGENLQYPVLCITTDSESIVIAGTFWQSTDLDPGPGIEERSPVGEADGCLGKFNLDGELEWVGTMKGVDQSSIMGINRVAVDGLGNIFVSGYFHGTVNFSADPHTTELISSRKGSAFYPERCLAKFGADGNLCWVRTWESGMSFRLAADEGGNIYLLGNHDTLFDADPGPGVVECGPGERSRMFLIKLNSDGEFQWIRNSGIFGYGLALDGIGGVYVSGLFLGSGVDFDPGPRIELRDSSGAEDAYVLKLNTDGDFEWAHTWGGTGYDASDAVSADDRGNVCVAGAFEDSVDFNPGPGEEIFDSGDASGIFLSVFSPHGAFRGVHVLTGVSTRERYIVGVGSLVCDGYGNAYLAGSFRETVQFGPSSEHIWSSNGAYDAFLCKFNLDYF